MNLHTNQPARAITYRLRGIPHRLDSIGVQSVIRSALSIQDNIGVQIKSLAENPYHYSRQEKVATLIFSSPPERLSSVHRKSEWKIEHIDHEVSGNQIISLVFDTHFHGFTPLHSDGDTECEADLIAVSGLGGHAFGSFQERHGSYMWLRDSLPSDLPRVRIYIYGYDSSLAKSDSLQTTLDLGKQLQNSIHTIRKQELRKTGRSRPLLFIGHSLGGILVKQALIEMSRGDASDQADLASTYGIMFFGVPSQGLDIKSLIPMVGDDQPNRFLLESLGKTSAVLKYQGREFSEAFKSQDSRIISFYETKQSPTAIEVAKDKWRMEGLPATLVDEYSATRHRTWEDISLPINRTHSEMVKFGSKYDEYYLQVRDQISNLKDDACAKVAAKFFDEDISIKQSLTLQQMECLHSLAFEEQGSRRHKIVAIEDGCNWLLQHRDYESWLGQKQGLLWIQGKPGAGKSTLMKFAVNSCESQDLTGMNVVSFFFNGRGAEIEKSPIGMTRSLLHQLLVLPRFYDRLVKFSAKFESRCLTLGQYGTRWNWRIEEVQDEISSIVMTTLRQPIYIFVDALDESGDLNANEITTWFSKLVSKAQSQKAQLYMCFSCRHYPIISWRDGHDRFVITVEHENQGAIRDFAETELTGILRLGDLRSILPLLIEKANGVFQWVALVVPRLLQLYRKGKSPKYIHQSLQAIPSDLNRLYGDLLQEIDDEDRDQSVKLLQWICFALRPLTVRELRHAMMMDVDKRYDYVKEYEDSEEFADDEESMEMRIIDLSRGLAEVKATGYERGSNADTDVEESTGDVESMKGNIIDAPKDLNDFEGLRTKRTVQFVHQSVQDYLIATGFKVLQVTSLGGSVVCAGHFRLSRSCIEYLSFEDRHRWTKQDVGIVCKKYPLLKYAAVSWMNHVKRVEDYGIVQGDLLRSLRWQINDVFESWILVSERLGLAYPQIYNLGSTLLHVASTMGCLSLASAILDKDGFLVNARDNGLTSPLHLAAEQGRIEVVELLLRQPSIEINVENDKGWTPLHTAALQGHSEVVELLLRQASIEINVKDDGGWTPLQIAAREDCSEVVELLLRQPSIEINVKSDTGWTPLYAAAGEGRIEVIELLLRQASIEINVKDDGGWTPLHVAALQGRIEVVELLLRQASIEINVKDDDGWTPLHVAALQGRIEVVELLLRQNAIDVNIKTEQGYTPLGIALGNHSTEIVRLLEHAGAKE